jgi:putative ABC transport system substrate-binding protein
MLTSTVVFAAGAPPARVIRIGYLVESGAPIPYPAFWIRLRELGYLEGRNLAVEGRSAEGRTALLPSLALELVRVGVDVIVAQGTPATLAARQATASIPIVMLFVGDPVAVGLIDSLRRPGGNVTGPSMMYTELSGKRLELLLDVVPQARRVAVLWNPRNASASANLREIEASSSRLGVLLQRVAVEHAEQLKPALQAMSEKRPAALIVLQDTVVGTNLRQIIDFAAVQRLPGIYPTRFYALEGGLMSYGPDADETARRAAEYVDRILRGDKPADLPVEQPTKFELVINLRTARAIGLTIPSSLRERAAELIQ